VGRVVVIVVVDEEMQFLPIVPFVLVVLDFGYVAGVRPIVAFGRCSLFVQVHPSIIARLYPWRIAQIRPLEYHVVVHSNILVPKFLVVLVESFFLDDTGLIVVAEIFHRCLRQIQVIAVVSIVHVAILRILLAIVLVLGCSGVLRIVRIVDFAVLTIVHVLDSGFPTIVESVAVVFLVVNVAVHAVFLVVIVVVLVVIVAVLVVFVAALVVNVVVVVAVDAVVLVGFAVVVLVEMLAVDDDIALLVEN
jgi:hypothetical protein